MAERPSVREIIEAVRAAGPARPEADAETPASAAEEKTPTAPTAGPDVEAAAEAQEPAEATPPQASTPPPPSPGRPLTLQEKLAAARNRPADQEPPPAAAPSQPAAAPESEPEAAPTESAEPAAPPPPVPSGRPLTLQEKLAAARGRPAGAAPAPGGARPAAKAKPAGAATAAKAASRTLPPLEKMSDPRDLAEALRRTGAERKPKKEAETRPTKTAPTAKKPAPAKAIPPRPTREAASARAATAPRPQAEVPPDQRRRNILAAALAVASSWMVLGWATLIAGLGAFCAMLGRFMFPNVLAEPPSTIKVGLPSDFDPETVNEDWKAEWGFWMVRSAAWDGMDKIYSLQSVCTHLGCPPNWLPSEQKFKCPCHGSGYYISGVNFEGPAPRPLERFKVTLADDGQILVDKSQKFQEELGQWTNPDSFVPV